VLFGVEYSQAGELLRAALWLAIPFSAVSFILPLFFARGAYSPVGLYGVLAALMMLVIMVPATSIASQTGALMAIGLGMSAWLVLMLLITRVYVPTYDRSRSLGAFATAVVAMLAHTLAAKLGMWPQVALSLAVLIAAAAAFRALDREDLRVLVRATVGMFAGKLERV
jgi:O-antigen/teichoic acid export membrane protein